MRQDPTTYMTNVVHEHGPSPTHSSADVNTEAIFIAACVLVLLAVVVSVYRYVMEDGGAYMKERLHVVMKVSFVIRVIIAILRLIFPGREL